MTTDLRNDTATNWFQRHPKKTLATVTLIVILAIVFAAEKFLEFNNRQHGIFLEAEVERRYAKLKEYRPGTRLLLTFPRNHLPYTDNVFTKKYRFNIDNNGFVAPSRKYDAPDKVIVFLGGSTTECMFVDEDHRMPYVAGQILEQETGAKINSYNGGMSGNNSLNAIDILINKVIPLKPDVVVFMENINDLSTLLYEGTYWNNNKARSPVETLKKRPLVGKLLKEIFIPNLNYAYKTMKKTLFKPKEDEFSSSRGKKLVDRPGQNGARFCRRPPDDCLYLQGLGHRAGAHDPGQPDHGPPGPGGGDLHRPVRPGDRHQLPEIQRGVRRLQRHHPGSGPEKSGHGHRPGPGSAPEQEIPL